MIDKIAEKIYFAIMQVLKVVGLTMIVAIVMQIANRYIPFIRCTWTEELARLAFIWFSFVGLATAFYKSRHMSINYFYLKVPSIGKIVLDYTVMVLIIAISIVICINGFSLSGIVKNQKSPMMGLSQMYFYLAVPVGFLFNTFFGFVKLIDYTKKLIKNTQVKEEA